MSELRFYLDESVSNDVARGLRNQGIDVLTTPAAGNMGLNDVDQIAFALREGRIIVTQDADYLRLHSRGFQHAGIVYYKPQTRTVKQLINALRLIYDIFSPEEMRNKVEYL